MDLCSGEEPTPAGAGDVDAEVEGEEEPQEKKDTRQKIEQFVKESFEAKDELFPEKPEEPSLLEELPLDVGEPKVVLPPEALPASPRAAWAGRWSRKHRCIKPGAAPNWGPRTAFHPDCSVCKVMYAHLLTTGPRGEPDCVSSIRSNVLQGNGQDTNCILLNPEHLKYVFSGDAVVKKKKSACQYRRRRFDPWVGKIPWRRKWQPPPVFLPGESHGQRSLVGYSPWGHEESDSS